jgi:hypothetical protein
MPTLSDEVVRVPPSKRDAFLRTLFGPRHLMRALALRFSSRLHRQPEPRTITESRFIARNGRAGPTPWLNSTLFALPTTPGTKPSKSPVVRDGFLHLHKHPVRGGMGLETTSGLGSESPKTGTGRLDVACRTRSHINGGHSNSSLDRTRGRW